MSVWEEYVPEVGLRPQQVEALDRVWGAFESGCRVVLLEAPTGVGKSIIQLALARRRHRERGQSSFLVTPQRALQDQMRQWRDLAIMKGRGAYSCNLVDSTAALAPCTVSMGIREENAECSDSACPFYAALTSAVKAPVVVHNYASLLAQSHMVSHFQPRDLLCLDEGHTASNWVRNFASFTIDDADVWSLEGRSFKTTREFVVWFSRMLRDMAEVPKGLTDDLRMTLARAMAFREMMPTEAEIATEVPWEAVYDQFAAQWTVLPMKVGRLSRVLTRLGSDVLVVTATVLDPRLLLAELGLQNDRHEYVRIDSAFDPRNRPIVRKYVGSMGKKYREANMGPLVQALAAIARAHPEEAGIVHTVSHQMASEVHASLACMLGGRPLEVVPRGPDRDEVIRKFLSGFSGRNAILIGPSLMEGIDAKDDSARWQALCKVPWPSMGDPVVSSLMASTGKARAWAERWYRWKAVQQSVQGFGRVCRTPTDRGVTYLLDRDFSRILESGMVPDYVMAALVR